MTTLERLRRRILLPIGFVGMFAAVAGAALDLAVLFRAAAVLVGLVLVGLGAVVALDWLAERADLGRQESAP